METGTYYSGSTGAPVPAIKAFLYASYTNRRAYVGKNAVPGTESETIVTCSSLGAIMYYGGDHSLIGPNSASKNGQICRFFMYTIFLLTMVPCNSTLVHQCQYFEPSLQPVRQQVFFFFLTCFGGDFVAI